MARKSRHNQPVATSRTRAEPPFFHVYEVADPEAHLSEEQKKWPLVGGWDPVPDGPGVVPPDAQYGEPNPRKAVEPPPAT